MATIDAVWRGRDVTPSEIADALRSELAAMHRRDPGHVPARALNLVAIVDAAYRGEIANRLAAVGRFHASRTIILAVERGRTTLEGVTVLSAPADAEPGGFGALRETVTVRLGPRHLEGVDRIVDPLVVSDLATCVWAPHGHFDAVRRLLGLAQVALLDSVDDPAPASALRRAREFAQEVYVVDLAWLRSSPWRERVATALDPPPLRKRLQAIASVEVRHHQDSTAAALLLVGWMASRLGWRPRGLAARGSALQGTLDAGGREVTARLLPDRTMPVRGLAGITLAGDGPWSLSLDRCAGGLRARSVDGDGERTWLVLGASRGESGILGEGIRQALLRDPTYAPALSAACALLG